MVQNSVPKLNNGTGSAFSYDVSGDLGKKSSELAVLQLNISVDTDSDYSSRPGGSVLQGNDNSDDHILAYVLIPLGALVLIAVLSFLVIFILKKSKLDRLRHHLMPLYNFDPMEEGGDWESELLEEDKEQQVALHIGAVSPDGPKLKFHTEQYEI